MVGIAISVCRWRSRSMRPRIVVEVSSNRAFRPPPYRGSAPTSFWNGGSYVERKPRNHL